MAKKCEVCGKGPMFGNSVSHSHKKTKRKWYPNLQSIKVLIKGNAKKMKVCSSCIRSNKVQKAS